MLAYDTLSFRKRLPRHQMLSRSEALAELPGLNPDGLKGAAVYYDAQVEFAERLVLENALSAVALGATVMTYARVDKVLIQDHEIRGVEFTTSIPGSKSSDVQRYSATARIVINAAGPWIDELLSNSVGSSPRLIGGTKGSHIIVRSFPGAPSSALYVEAESDHRPFFIIPWNGHFLIGTTDIRYTGNLDHVQIEDDEIDYLLCETNRVIPGARLSIAEILYTYAGVRPLAFDSGKDEQSITRRHFIRSHPHAGNLFSIVGGKLTTYRSLAEETVDILFKTLEETLPHAPPLKCHCPAPPRKISPPSAKTSKNVRHFLKRRPTTYCGLMARG